MRRIWCVGIVLAAGIALLISLVPRLGAESPPIKIGLLLASTGNAVLSSKEAGTGFRTIMDQVDWKVAGRKIVAIE